MSIIPIDIVLYEWCLAELKDAQTFQRYQP
jgi:hypothetical protein